jgi:membrane-associated phospholipid phosphatase
MNRKNYEKITAFFKANKAANMLLKIVYKIFPLIIFAAYPLLLLWVWFLETDLFIKTLVAPASVFVLVTVLRVIINEKRPYERYGIKSVFDKQTKGKSMPSRHTASAFIISMAVLRISVPLGIVFLGISTLIAVSRVLSGVHYIRDVLVGIWISITCGILYIFF